MTEAIKQQLSTLKLSGDISELGYRKARAIYVNGNCQILSRSAKAFDVLVFDDGEEDNKAR